MMLRSELAHENGESASRNERFRASGDQWRDKNHVPSASNAAPTSGSRTLRCPRD
jgi:hypothetical protein